MRALILAAGRGTRLGADNRPKCLTALGGTTLLDRYLDTLHTLDVPVTIVVGHGAEFVIQHVQRRANAPRLLLNQRYTEGSIVSLSVGLNMMAPHHDNLLLLDGDVAFEPSLLATLVHDSSNDALLVDMGTVFTDEQYMAGISLVDVGANPVTDHVGTDQRTLQRGATEIGVANSSRIQQRVMALRRGPVDGFDLQGEWVGFTKLGADTVGEFQYAIDQQITRGQTTGGYEDALARLLATIPFIAIPTAGAPWIEIDFQNDLAKAESLFKDSP